MVVDERGYYNISQAADLLGVSRSTIWRWVRAGRLPVSRLGHRTTRIARDDLERMLDRDSGNGRATQAEWAQIGPAEHIVQFYETDRFLLDAVVGFIGPALDAGDVGIVIATAAHRQQLDDRLRAAGHDLDAARAAGRLVSLDAEETLARLMNADLPDRERFFAVAGEIVDHAARDGYRVRVFGEMVALLAEEGRHAAALRLEELWNELQQTYAFALLCAYPMDRLAGEPLAALLSDICEAHSRVIPAEGYVELPTVEHRLRAVTMLQQQAHSLAGETARRARADERLRDALAAERAARLEAEAALRLRDEFLTVAAHELKTPLTGLAGRVQLLLRQFVRDGQLQPERVTRGLAAISVQAEKLSKLLNQLLDITRLESGQLALDRRPVDVVPLVEQVVFDMTGDDARCVVALDAPSSLAGDIDPLRLEQVLTNLLDNAIKYSPDGASIDVAVARTSRGTIELSVRDRGPGIPPERRARIFERYYQAHDDSVRPGLGLGLYISHQIVELHGGEIRAEFPPDGGARFVVHLPPALDTSPTSRAAD